MTMCISKWGKGDTVHIDGRCYLITQKPKKAIDGSWVVFMSDTEGKVSMTYFRDEQLMSYEQQQKGTQK